MRRTWVWVAVVLALAACTEATEPSTVPEQTTVVPVEVTNDLTCWVGSGGTGSADLEFEDVTEEAGLLEPLKGMHGHAAIWTDHISNNIPDLFVGTFADRDAEVYMHRGADGASPDRFLLGNGGTFTQLDFPEAFSRSSGGVSVDLDRNGFADLVVSRNIKDGSLGQTPTAIYSNSGGAYELIEDSGIDPSLGGRSVAVLDYDKDGLLDLFIVVDKYAGGDSRLYRNTDDLRFEDVTTDAGLPGDIEGLGVAAADFDQNGHKDLFIGGSNRLFLGSSDGFTESDRAVFEWDTFGNEDDVGGVSFGDVNRDGHLDLVVGHHYNSTLDFDERVPVRLYLNDGEARFRDVTEEAGLTPLPTKAPHVEINDFNNDGWPDILTSASAGDGPAIFLSTGLNGDVPVFATPTGLGNAQYWVTAPTTDYNADGRLDLILVEWEPALPSIMLRNETAGGNWIQVSVSNASEGAGVGWRVEVQAHDEVIGAGETTVTQGYSAGVLPIAHFGLGDVEMVDVLLTDPIRGETIRIEDVAANQHIRWPFGC